MPIEYVAGDLFAGAHRPAVLAHGCNCQGSMGAGIAVQFRERYPAMYEAYRAMCQASPRQFNPGDAWLWREDGEPRVFNLATQERYWRGRATYEWLESALRAMREQADAEDVTRLAMPRVGAGPGGLSWTKVKAIIDRAFGDWAGELVVYEEYVPGQK
jgi:O-acetyl-ADP-ribose deacetylase (regulator of RNase III)